MINQSYPYLVGSWLVEIFMHLGLNQVHGLILGLVFQVGGFGLSGTRVMSSNWTRVTDQILDARGVAHLLRDLSELISAATSHTLGSTRGDH